MNIWLALLRDIDCYLDEAKEIQEMRMAESEYPTQDYVLPETEEWFPSSTKQS